MKLTENDPRDSEEEEPEEKRNWRLVSKRVTKTTAEGMIEEVDREFYNWFHIEEVDHGA